MSGERAAPLQGIRVLELGSLIAAPYCAMLLGELGAEVIKVEHPFSGDPSREIGPVCAGGQSTLFLGVNRNKRSLALDVGRAEGHGLLTRLVAGSDVLVVNLRPDVVAGAGVDYEAVREINPGLIYCSMSAFGEVGPYRMKAGTDNIFQGMAGLMSVSGEEGDPPARMGIAPADMAAATFAALGVVSALLHRERTGEGQKLSVSLIDSLIALQTPRIQEYLVTGKDPPRTGTASPFAAPSEFYETQDGYINISVFTDKFWRRLCRAVSMESLIDDPRFKGNEARLRNRKELKAILGDVFRRGSTSHWRETLDRADIPNGPIYRYSEVFSDPQIRENRMIVELNQPAGEPTRLVNQPIRFQTTPASVRNRPPRLGEHTLEILTAVGVPRDEIYRMEREGMVRCCPALAGRV